MPKKSKTPYLKITASTPRLVLRAYKVSDHKRIHESHRARLHPHNDFDKPFQIGTENLAKFKTRLARHRKLAKKGHTYIFGVFLKKTGEFVGQVDLWTINSQLAWGNLGYHIQNSYFGRGFAVEAGLALLNLAFKKLGYHRIEASMETNNQASLRVCEKIGLDPEGIRKNFFAGQSGVHMRVFAMNAVDWHKILRK